MAVATRVIDLKSINLKTWPVALFVAFNLVDALWTVVALSSGVYYENMPLTKAMLSMGAPFFIGAKVSMSVIACLALCVVRRARVIKYLDGIMVLVLALNLWAVAI